MLESIAPSPAQVETFDMLVQDTRDDVIVAYMEVIDRHDTGRMWVETTCDGLTLAAVFGRDGRIVGNWI